LLDVNRDKTWIPVKSDDLVLPKQIDKYPTVPDCSFAVSIIFSVVQNQDQVLFESISNTTLGPLPSAPGSSDPCLLRAKLFGQR
jgi:hypothetical protein